MGVDPHWYYEWQQRQIAKNHAKQPPSADACDLEIEGVHEPIIKWCESQHPMVPYIHSRTDRKTTTNLGVPDLVLFYRKHCIIIEGKSKTGKLTPEQLAWKMLADLQGFDVLIIKSYQQFLAVIETICQPALRGAPDAQSQSKT